jgi:hypothetical protein
MTWGRPWRVPLDPVHRIMPELHALSAGLLDELARRGAYTADEVAALKTPTTGDKQCSWAETPDELAGPLTEVAPEDGNVIAGVELFQNKRDRYWFLDGLIRNQDAKYRGAGGTWSLSRSLGFVM